ncbi:hypothetical protein B0J13DRAFT_111287 [Dactylonectria estremocensis]|uniref:Uncharacterized protein n=1 Tax=Dactylonectria estremocensis TaxID=1079267 RepID=A0A9P9FEX7_9HYPO|nr:hypothetical protein B0J13DRAFT_111287 [Dactylonectria estremocensis]
MSRYSSTLFHPTPQGIQDRIEPEAWMAETSVYCTTIASYLLQLFAHLRFRLFHLLAEVAYHLLLRVDNLLLFSDRFHVFFERFLQPPSPCATRPLNLGPSGASPFHRCHCTALSDINRSIDFSFCRCRSRRVSGDLVRFFRGVVQLLHPVSNFAGGLRRPAQSLRHRKGGVLIPVTAWNVSVVIDMCWSSDRPRPPVSGG